MLITIFAIAIFFIIINLYDNKEFGWATFASFFMSLVVFEYWLFNQSTEDLGLINQNISFIKTLNISIIIEYVLAYIGIGVIVSYINYVLFILRVKERYNEIKQQTNLNAFQYPSALTKFEKDEYFWIWNYIKDHCDDLFENVNYSINISYPSSEKTSLQCIEEFLPPKMRHFKGYVVSSAIIWPITLVWILLYRFISQTINEIINYCKNLFDYTSKKLFGGL